MNIKKNLNKLNGWQRIGIIASFCWCLFILTWLMLNDFSTGEKDECVHHYMLWDCREVKQKTLPLAETFTREVNVKFTNGEQYVYRNLPDNITAEKVSAMIQNDFDARLVETFSISPSFFVALEVAKKNGEISERKFLRKYFPFVPIKKLFFSWSKLFLALILPIVTIWVIPYFLIWLYKWIAIGFRKDEKL